jgi:2-keto-3-deoxy-L-fuconate dehydrogenase
MRLQGKTAVVTAAGQGIGFATAQAFAAEGARVIAVDRNEASIAELASSNARIEAVTLDLTDQTAVDSLAMKINEMDILFNCVGVVHAGNVLECSSEDWRSAFDLNVTTMFTTVRAFLPKMLEAGGGSIINVASVASSIKGVPSRFAYSASKGAVIGLTKSIAVDFVDQGIRCNAICPGTIESPSLHKRLAATGDFDGAWNAFVARQPMGRIGRPEEIASVAVFLAGDESSFTTGQTHIIDGGWCA